MNRPGKRPVPSLVAAMVLTSASIGALPARSDTATDGIGVAQVAVFETAHGTTIALPIADGIPHSVRSAASLAEILLRCGAPSCDSASGEGGVP